MIITPLRAFQDNYIWTFQSIETNQLVCVDPGDATPVLAFSERIQAEITDVLITHHHYDHAGGLAGLQAIFPNIRIFGPLDSRIPLINCPVQQEDIVKIGPYRFQVIAIPGHTSSHIAYFETNKRWLFCGDTLFSAGCGRVFDGTLEDLFQSLALLAKLPDETAIYCGHEYTLNNLRFASLVEPSNHDVTAYLTQLKEKLPVCTLPSSIALEKKINPFLRTNMPELAPYAKMHNIPLSQPFKIFKKLRHDKDNFT